MRTLITFLFLFSSFWSIGQKKWDFKNSVWHYDYINIFSPIQHYLTIEYSGSAELGSERQFVSKLDMVAHYGEDRNELINSIYVYADEDRVYQWLDGEFHILYDFSLDIGDTTRIYANDGYHSGEAVSVVDSVKKVSIGTDTLRAYYIRGGYQGFFHMSGWVYESIGTLIGFGPQSALSCDGGCLGSLRCFKNSAIDYQVEVCDTIKDLRVSTIDIDEEQTRAEPRLYPNPLSRHQALHIEYSDISSLSVSVYDMEGRVILTEQAVSDGSLSLPADMSAGIYMVHVVDRDSWQSYYDKLVVY